MTELHRLTKRLQFSFENNLKVFQLLWEIEQLKGSFVVSQKLSYQTIKRLKQSVLITSTGASNRIEWNKLNDEEVEKLYNAMRIKKFKSRDEQEVGGYLEILELVFSSYGDIAFSESSILDLHNRMLSYTEKDTGHRGKYKFGPNRVEARDSEGNVLHIVFDPTDPAMTPIEMFDLIAWTKESIENNAIPSLLIVANFLFEFLAIHPFQDGNGRMSRILTNLLMLQCGYSRMPYVSHEAIIEQNKIAYYKALNTTQKSWKTEQEDISAWVFFFFECVIIQAKKAVALQSGEHIEFALSPKQLQVWKLFQEQKILTRRYIAEHTTIPYVTVGQILSKLVAMKKIEKKGERRGVVYELI